MADGSYLDADGVYDSQDPAIVALLDQQRAEAGQIVKTSRCVHLVWMNPEGDGTEWCYIGNEHIDLGPFFLTYAAAKAIHSLHRVTGMPLTDAAIQALGLAERLEQ